MTAVKIGVVLLSAGLLSVSSSYQSVSAEALRQPKRVKGTFQTIAYPKHHLRARRQGYVLVEYRVSMNGKAYEPNIMHSDPPGAFDSVVLREVARWRFDLPGDWSQRWESERFPFFFAFRIGDCEAPAPPVNVPALPAKTPALLSCVP